MKMRLLDFLHLAVWQYARIARDTLYGKGAEDGNV